MDSSGAGEASGVLSAQRRIVLLPDLIVQVVEILPESTVITAAAKMPGMVWISEPGGIWALREEVSIWIPVGVSIPMPQGRIIVIKGWRHIGDVWHIRGRRAGLVTKTHGAASQIYRSRQNDQQASSHH